MPPLTLSVKSEYLTWMAHLRHELYTPLNAIHGYSELLMEELEDVGPAHGDFAHALRRLHQVGGRIFTLISQSMSGDTLCAEAEQSVSASLSQAADDSAIWTASWEHLKQQAFIGNLQPWSLELGEFSTQLKQMTPPEFQGDIEKIAIASRNFQLMVQAVLSSQAWPCELWPDEPLTERHETSTASVAPLATIADLHISSSSSEKAARAVADLEEKPPPTSSRAAIREAALPKIPESTSSRNLANVLVVDDNGANCDLLCRYIIRQGHQVTPVPSGQQALTQIKTGAYDLILLDILMPEMNGYEVLEWIRNSEWRHLSVIMISSLDELDSVVKCIEMGAEDYLPKPFNPTLLKARVDACLEKKRLRDQEVQYLDQLAVANEKIMHLNEQLKVENGRLSAELDITRRIQQMMLPRPQELAQIKDLDVVGFMKPADEVGGDYYDVICRDDGIVIGIGDVTGHGLESGLLMLMIQTAVRTLVEQGSCDYQHFLDVINRTILSNAGRMETSRNSSLSLIHYHKGILSISGQHEEVIVIRSNGEIEKIDTINLGFPMGLDHDISEFLGKTEIELNLQDVVILYTDGITEAENSKGQFYGIERLAKVAAQHRDLNVEEIRSFVISDLTRYIDNHQIFDDITLLVMKRNA